MDKNNLAQYYSDNVGLVHHVAQKGYGRLQAIGASIEYDDVVQDMSMVFIKAYQIWDEEKSKFSTYYINAAINELNKIAKKFETERLELKIKSVEEMDHGNEDVNVAETIACDRDTPERALESNRLIQAVVSGLSPLAEAMVEWMLSPPDWVERELAAKQIHAEMARDMGHKRRAVSECSIGFVCDMLELSGVPGANIRSARQELTNAVRRNV
jgi:DNA-directed RNA polymerase specialized sigma24 family protein